MLTRRLAPSLAPSGAKTELHESMKACVSDPPHDSPPALRSVTPESVADGAHGKGGRRRRDARRQRPGQRDDLERRAGRLRRRHGEAGERQHRPVARAHHRHAAELAPERGRRGALQPGPDGGVDRVPTVAPDRGDDAVAEAQLRPGRARQARRRTGARARCRGHCPRAARPAMAAVAGLAESSRPSAPSTWARVGTREDDPAHLLAGAQAGEAQVRLPRDARRAVLVVHRHRDRASQRPEQARRHSGRQVEAPVALLGEAADAYALDGRLGLRRLYEACEPGPRIGCAAALVEHEPHPGRVPPHPRGGEALRRLPTHVLLVMTVEHEPHRPAGRRQHDEHDEQRSPRHAVAAAAPAAPGLEPRHPGAPRRSRGEHRAASATAGHRHLSSVPGGGMRCAPSASAGWIGQGEWVSTGRYGRATHVDP